MTSLVTLKANSSALTSCSMREGVPEKELQAAAPKRISSQMLLTSQSFYFMLICKLFNEGRSGEKDLHAATPKRISSHMLLTPQSLPFMLIGMVNIAVHVNNSCILSIMVHFKWEFLVISV